MLARIGSGEKLPRTGFPKRSCSIKKMERDGDSKKSHPALGHQGSSKQVGKEGRQPRLGSLSVIAINLICQCFPIPRQD
jgi:hypothetical protein